ncbi:MAG: PAS domain S-box protein, partial [Chitinophagaceae bacterium]
MLADNFYVIQSFEPEAEKLKARIEFDLDGKVLNANALFLDLVEYTLDEVKGRHHSLFVTPEERESAAYKSFWADLLAGQ